MPSHMSDIGFNVETEKQFQELASRAYEEGQAFEMIDGAYIKWAPGEGIEVWLQVDVNGDIVGINPHFSGISSMRVCLDERIRGSEGSLDGAFHAWANPENETPDTGDFPFVFDVPDFHLTEATKLPAVVTIQLAAFAHELQSFASDEDHEKSQNHEIKFASESFIPAGTFVPEGQPPVAEAVFTGHVLETALITNPVTGAEFCWAKTRTLGGEIDVVADPALLNGLLVEGGVLTGSFWLSGRLLT
ncbi:MAG: hypothetical protein ACT4OT_15395 [Acidobacteriota bacterium]